MLRRVVGEERAGVGCREGEEDRVGPVRGDKGRARRKEAVRGK